MKPAENSQAECYRTTIRTGVSCEDAYASIGRVNEWWTGDFQGSASALGDQFTVSFGETYVSFRVSAAEPPFRVTWQVTDCHLHWLEDKREWMGTAVRFRLET